VKINFNKLPWNLEDIDKDGFTVRHDIYSYFYNFSDDWLLPDVVIIDNVEAKKLTENESSKLRQRLQKDFPEAFL